MAETWDEMAVGNRVAAQHLLHNAKAYRSSVSRSYYAAFSAATHVLRKQATPFRLRREAPDHRDVPRMLAEHMRTDMEEWGRRKLKAAVRRLYNARLDADYRPRASIDSEIARDALRDACWVLRTLGVRE